MNYVGHIEEILRMDEKSIALVFAGGSAIAAFIVPLCLHFLEKRRADSQRRARAKNISTMVIMELAGIVPALKALRQCNQAIHGRSTMEQLEPLRYRLVPRATPILDRIVDWAGDVDERHASGFAEVYAMAAQYRESLDRAFSPEGIHIARYRFQQLAVMQEGLLRAIFDLVDKLSDLSPMHASGFKRSLEDELSTVRVHDSRQSAELK